MDRLPKALSGGQRQRVAIGRAIVRQPRVFLFDEPLSNLDAALRVQTRLEIAKLHRDIGSASMIYVTHDQVEAMTLADRIVLLRSGPAVAGRGQRGAVRHADGPVPPAAQPVRRRVHRQPEDEPAARQAAARRGRARGGRRARRSGDAWPSMRARPVPATGSRSASAPSTWWWATTAAPARRCAGTLQQMERLGDSSLLYLRVEPGRAAGHAQARGRGRAGAGRADQRCGCAPKPAICSTPTARRSSARVTLPR